MRKLTAWLIELEFLAEEFYREAAEFFREDEVLRDFLEHTAEDEAEHWRIMRDASDFVRTNDLGPAPVSMDEETKSRIEAPFRENLALLREGLLTARSLLDGIVTAEFSEWNSIFLYVVNRLKMENTDYRLAAVGMQHHLRHIEHFVTRNGGNSEYAERINRLPAVWREKILVVDDDPLIAELLQAVLSREGEVDLAENGLEALGKLETTYYKLIFCDVNMPVMDGLEFFRRASAKYENLAQRLVFFTAVDSRETVSFFQENGLRFLSKPSPLGEIKKAALRVMHQIA